MLLRLLFLLFPVCCFCQGQFRFDHFSIKNGLSQNTVHCVLKDSEGYYWLGTQDGLNKYDGYSVQVFRHDNTDSTTISDNFILTIQEDRQGNLWIGTRNGLNHYDKHTGRFTKPISNEKERDHYHASVWNIFIDADGNIMYSNIEHQLAKITAEDAATPPFSPRIIADRGIIHKNARDKYSIAEPEMKQVRFFDSKHNLQWETSDTALHQIYTVVETPGGQRLIGSTNGLFISEKGGPLVPIKNFLGHNVNKLLCDSKHNIWVGTSSGLYFFAGSDMSAAPQILTHSTENLHSLASNSVQELYEDPDGLIWVGTSEGGVSIYDPSKSIFKIFNHSSPIALSANSIWGIYQDKNQLWIGTNSGLNHLTFENKNISGAYSDKNELTANEIFVTNGTPNSIAGNSITGITKDKQGRLWFGSNSNGISVFNPATKTWKQFNTRNSSLKSDVIFHLLCASDGRIWISSLSGFYCADPSTGTFTSFLSKASGGSFSSGYIISTYEDSKKNIWVGSTGGIYHLKSNGEVIGIYKNEPGKATSLSYNMATSFLEDSKGRMWITTLGGGINRFDPTTGTFKAYTKRDGLANDIIYTALEDKQGKIWISSNSGISCFDPEAKTFSNYTEKDGIVANEFCQNSGFVNEAGEMLFGSPEGLVVFNPAEVKSNRNDIPILISSLKVNYKPVSLTGNSIDLDYRDNTITFEFTAPDFRNQEKIQYAFQMEGFDNTWHEVPASTRMASFTSLPFGNYIFKIRVRTGNNEWQAKILALHIHVIPPFWLRTWFILLEILTGLAIVVLLVRYYSQRKLKKQLQAVEMQRKIHLEKERISRDLHDNVGAHLTYIITSLDNITYKIEKGEKGISKDKISYLSDFSRSTMQQLRESIWAINKENITLAELKDKISDYSSRMASASNMNFQMEFDSRENIPLKPSHAINVYRIVQEAVNNSVKHSCAKALTVNIGKNGGQYIYIRVLDNGKGVDPGTQGTGYGLKNMQDRVKDLGGDIFIDSNSGGTTISFTIPV